MSICNSILCAVSSGGKSSLSSSIGKTKIFDFVS
jgi:hypothetical protein